MDPFGVGKATLDVWQAMLKEPERLAESQAHFAKLWIDLWTRNADRAVTGTNGETPVVAPESGDRRFATAAWTENLARDTLKQADQAVTQAFRSGRRWRNDG